MTDTAKTISRSRRDGNGGGGARANLLHWGVIPPACSSCSATCNTGHIDLLPTCNVGPAILTISLILWDKVLRISFFSPAKKFSPAFAGSAGSPPLPRWRQGHWR
jgi:hypothetical protein